MATNDISDVVNHDGINYHPRESVPARSSFLTGRLSVYALACWLALSLAGQSKAQAAPIPSDQPSKNSTLLSRWYDLKFGVGAEREEAFQGLGLAVNTVPQNSAGVAEGDTQRNLSLDYRLVGDVPNPKTGLEGYFAFIVPEYGSIDANLGGKESKGGRIKLTGGYANPKLVWLPEDSLILEPNLTGATGTDPSKGDYGETGNIGYGLRLKTQALELPGGKYIFFVDANSETAKYTADGLVGELKGDVSGKESGFGALIVPSWTSLWLPSSIKLAYRNASKSYGGDLTGTNRDDVSSLDAALIWTPGDNWLVAPRASYEDLTLRADDSRVSHSQEFGEIKAGGTIIWNRKPRQLVVVNFAIGEEELDASVGYVWQFGAAKK